MQLTVLGKSPSWQDRGGACTGYLVRTDGYAMVLDCGSGVFGWVREQLDYLEVDAVLISHMHADHILDLIPFASALSYSPRREASPGGRWPRPSLHLPPGGRDTLQRLCAAFGDGSLIERAFATSEYTEGETLALGPLAARFCEVPHFVRAFAVRLTGPDRRSFTFGADCGPNEALPAFADGSELLIVEATTPPDSGPGDPDGVRGHMTPQQAGELGRRAGVPRLLISHYTDEVDPAAVLAEAQAAFAAEVELATQGLTVSI